MATVTVREVARALKIKDMAAWRRVEVAVKHGWLENLEERDHRPAQLRLGEPLPNGLACRTRRAGRHRGRVRDVHARWRIVTGG